MIIVNVCMYLNKFAQSYAFVTAIVEPRKVFFFIYYNINLSYTLNMKDSKEFVKRDQKNQTRKMYSLSFDFTDLHTREKLYIII